MVSDGPSFRTDGGETGARQNSDSERWEVVADLVTEDGKPASVTSSPAPREVAESLADDLKDSFGVRSLLIHEAGDRDE